MDVTFADISSAYMAMVPNRPPGKGGADGNTAGSREEVFADKLSSKLKSENTPEDSAATDVSSEQAGVSAGNDGEYDVQKVMQFLSKAMDQENAPAFAAALKTVFLMLSGGDLENASLDASGLTALKKLLVKSGFKEADLEVLMSDLKQESEDNQIPIGDLLDGLFELIPQDQGEKDAASLVYLESSARPFIESILMSLGIPEKKIEQILSDADHKDNGLDLDKIIQELKNIQKTASQNGTEYQSQTADKTISEHLARLEMGVQAASSPQQTDSAPKTLGDVIKIFEKIQDKIQTVSPAASDDSALNAMGKDVGEKNSDLLATVFKGFESGNQEEGRNIFQFDAGQISKAFKSATEKSLPEKAAGKSEDKHSAGLKAEMKHAAHLFEEQSRNRLSRNDSQAGDSENRNTFRQVVSRENSSSELLQSAVSNSRSADPSAATSSVKTPLPVKTLPAHVTHQVEKSIVRAVNQGENILKIQLKPPELGRLMMTIEKSGNSMRVSVVTESLAAREILSTSAADLKSALSNSGVSLERFEVDMNSDFRQSMADAGNQARNQSRRHKNSFQKKMEKDAIEQMGAGPSSAEATGMDSSLHFVA